MDSVLFVLNFVHFILNANSMVFVVLLKMTEHQITQRHSNIIIIQLIQIIKIGQTVMTFFQNLPIVVTY